MAYRRVVGLGLCVVDHAYRVEGFDPAEPRTRFTERRVSSGGMIATALAQAAALGCNSHVLSVLGADSEGRFLRGELRAARVKTGRLILSPRLPTTVAVVLVDSRSGERRFKSGSLFRGPSGIGHPARPAVCHRHRHCAPGGPFSRQRTRYASSRMHFSVPCPLSRARSMAKRATTVLPDPTSPWRSLFIWA